MLLTMCDRCAEKMDADRYPENGYFLTEQWGSRRPGRCAQCGREVEVAQYEAESKAVIAMRRAIARQQESPGKDTRAHWRKPWREGMTD